MSPKPDLLLVEGAACDHRSGRLPFPVSLPHPWNLGHMRAVIVTWLLLTISLATGADAVPPLAAADEKALLDLATYEGDKQAIRKLIQAGSPLYFAAIIADIKKAGSITKDQERALGAYPDSAFSVLAPALLTSEDGLGFNIIHRIVLASQPTLKATREIAQNKRPAGTRDRRYLAPAILAWVTDRPGHGQVICDAVALFGTFEYTAAVPWVTAKQQAGDQYLVKVWDRFADKANLTSATALQQLATELKEPASDIIIADVAAEALLRMRAKETAPLLRKTYDAISGWRLDNVTSAAIPPYTAINLYQESLLSYRTTLRSALCAFDPAFLDAQLAELSAPVDQTPPPPVRGSTITAEQLMELRVQQQDQVNTERAAALYRYLAKEGQVEAIGRISGNFLGNLHQRYAFSALTDAEPRSWIELDAYWEGVSPDLKTVIADQLATGFTAAMESRAAIESLGRSIPACIARQMNRVRSEKLSGALLVLIGKLSGNSLVEIAKYAADIGDQRFMDPIKAGIDRSTFDGHKRELQVALVKLKRAMP